MCQNSTPSQKPLSGGWAKVQGHATAQLQLSNQSPVMCQPGISVMRTSIRHKREYDTDRSYATASGTDERPANVRFGSKADICSARERVRFTPESGHVQCSRPCPLWAKSGHCVTWALQRLRSSSRRPPSCFHTFFTATLPPGYMLGCHTP